MSRTNIKKLIGFIAGVIIAAAFFFAPPPEGLSHEAMVALGFLIAAVVWMIFETMADYVAMMCMCACWVIFGAAPTKVAFATFSNNTFWLLLGALAIGAGTASSGLLNRISLKMMSLFPATHKGQCAALMTTGLVTGPLIPSTTAKAGILGPIARSIADKFNYGDDSRGGAGLFAAFYMGSTVSAPLFLSSSFIAYSALALAADYCSVSWLQWLYYALPWNILVLSTLYFIGLKIYKPEHEVHISKEDIKAESANLGPMSAKEKITVGVLVFCLVFWMLENIIGVAAGMTATMGVVIMLALGVYDRQTFRSKIAWDSLVFIGCIISLGDVFSATGVNTYIREMLAPVIIPLLSNIWLFVPLFCIVIFAMRFVVASWVAAMTIVIVPLLPFCAELGIHPFIIVFISYVCVQTWNTIYQSAPYISAQVSTGQHLGNHSTMRKFSWIYMALCIAGLMIAVFWWKLLGLLP